MSRSSIEPIDRLAKEIIIIINRAPVLVLWCSIVAQAEGYSQDLSLKAAKAIASMLARIKGQRLGIFNNIESTRSSSAVKPYFLKTKKIAGFKIPLDELKEAPTSTQIRQYLQKSFGKSLPLVCHKMKRLCDVVPDIGSNAYKLYEQFRPHVSRGVDGWAQKGILDLKIIDRIVSHYKRLGK